MPRKDEILYTDLTLEEARTAHPLKRPEPGDPRSLITTSFEVSGVDLDPLECTEIIGLQPTASAGVPRERGVWAPSGLPNVINPFWRLQRKAEPGDDINDEMSQVLNLLWPRREGVLTLTKRPGYTAGFLTSVAIFEDRPVYCLAPETLRRLAYFGLEWCLDIFDYRE